mmetsp:Transcript_66124/g.158181  ORF Transcript_66124/g.158181 Transcript_66124/m.158181 type:complete len:159 (-) Transcript_66124:198-674(-)
MDPVRRKSFNAGNFGIGRVSSLHSAEPNFRSQGDSRRAGSMPSVEAGRSQYPPHLQDLLEAFDKRELHQEKASPAARSYQSMNRDLSSPTASGSQDKIEKPPPAKSLAEMQLEAMDEHNRKLDAFLSMVSEDEDGFCTAVANDRARSFKVQPTRMFDV